MVIIEKKISEKFKNYSTSISVEKTINEIEKILAKHNVKRVFKEYSDNQTIKSLAFTLEIGSGIERKELAFKMPAEPEKVLVIFKKNLEPRYCKIEQAERTAWRVIKDWLDSNLAMVQIDQVKLEQILLPFMYDIKTDKTLFEKFQERNFDLAIEGKVDNNSNI